MASSGAEGNVSGQLSKLSGDVSGPVQSNATQETGQDSCNPEAMDCTGPVASANSTPGVPKTVQSKPKTMFTTSERNEAGLYGKEVTESWFPSSGGNEEFDCAFLIS